MTPGIHPSNVKIKLRKKLPKRPVINTANGGSTTQKKYRSAFTSSSLSSLERWTFSSLLSGARNLRSPDSRADRDKVRAAFSQDRHLCHQSLFPCTCRSGRCALQAFPNGASRRGRYF